ncbi:MAG: two component transcriptional regulator, LuxR family [Conexibacter sp.]|nr:two component transcriptional regulator, LuxR family [Conexibacter sp.]MDX6714591.1 hypothetical protein [Baekduia sp.]
MIHVLIDDDHAVVQTGLDELLAGAGDVRVVAVARSGEEAIRLADETEPDVVLVDLSRPGADGVAATRTIRERHPGTQVVALTSPAERERILAAIEVGALDDLLAELAP